LPLDEQKFLAESNFRNRELGLREREVAAKEAELHRSKWSNPLTIGLLAGGIGLLGNLVVTALTDYHSAKLESARNVAALKLETERDEAERISIALSKQWDPQQACNNMKLLVKLSLLHDKDGTINGCAAQLQAGGLGANEGQTSGSNANGSANPPSSVQPKITPDTANQFQSAPVATDSLTIPAARALSQVREKYFDQKETPLHNALVISDGGWAGIAARASTPELAKMMATAHCVGFAGPFDTCRLLYVDGKVVGTWKK
jgi:hypothetical protein